MKRRFRIHGDNVVECERTLRLLEAGLKLKSELVSGSSPAHPEFRFKHPSAGELMFELLPGHGRWGVDLAQELLRRGARIRENADSLITEIKGTEEEIIFGIEYCGALPAGNQAWQRHGRAYSFAQSKTPYLIFNEVGGTELDAERGVKASRYPNPTAPFALLLLSKDLGSVVLPIYESAVSAPPEVKNTFKSAFGIEDATSLIAALVLGESTKAQVSELESKTLSMVELLTKSRVRKDSIGEADWAKALASKDRFTFLKTKSGRYSRKTTDKVQASKTASKFLDLVLKAGALDFYSGSLPFTWIPKEQKTKFLESLTALYKNDVETKKFDPSKDLVIVFVTGFKPRGDDSRPDRGLTPLGRMLAGPNAELLTFLWGPAKEAMLKRLKADHDTAASLNGLIEAVVTTSDFVLVDSVNHSPFLIDTRNPAPVARSKKASRSESFVVSEHDVDSVIHFLVTQPNRPEYFEGLCNPPGGDWSGISLQDKDLEEIRWTSLPRVSSSAAKRPDHVIQFHLKNSNYVLAVESKLDAGDMDLKVGPNLIRYVDELTKVHPNARRKNFKADWQVTSSETVKLPAFKTYSAAAFRINNSAQLKTVQERSQADLVIGIELSMDLSEVTIYLKADQKYKFLVDDFKSLIASSSFNLKVKE
jgi:hypothetical protein